MPTQILLIFLKQISVSFKLLTSEPNKRLASGIFNNKESK
jgi:hypothetical protein